MPIYTYQCGACGNEFDLKQGFDASTETVCPMCDETARRRFVAPTVIYKGSGFYTTDYARKGSGSSNGASSSSSESKSDSKSDSKAESKSSESKTAESKSESSKSKASSESK